MPKTRSESNTHSLEPEPKKKNQTSRANFTLFYVQREKERSEPSRWLCFFLVQCVCVCYTFLSIRLAMLHFGMRTRRQWKTIYIYNMMTMRQVQVLQPPLNMPSATFYTFVVFDSLHPFLLHFPFLLFVYLFIFMPSIRFYNRLLLLLLWCALALMPASAPLDMHEKVFFLFQLYCFSPCVCVYHRCSIRCVYALCTRISQKCNNNNTKRGRTNIGTNMVCVRVLGDVCSA